MYKEKIAFAHSAGRRTDFGHRRLQRGGIVNDYSVFIVGFDGGYRVDRGTDEDTDLLCFDDMIAEEKCIEKIPLMWVGRSKNTGQFYR